MSGVITSIVDQALGRSRIPESAKLWSSSYYLQTCGSTYRVGPKWGKFAPDRLSAIREALAEFDDRVPAALVNELRRMV